MQFSPRTKCPDFDERDAPACELAGFDERFFLQIEQLNDETVGGLELFEEFADEFAGRERIAGADVVFAGEDSVEHVGFILREIGPAEFGAAFLRAQVVDAGRHGDA